jgi:RNA polymerase sigma-70 factor (ECF subfamily)
VSATRVEEAGEKKVRGALIPRRFHAQGIRGTIMSHDNGNTTVDWNRFRDFLTLLVRLQADLRWQGKIDLSGVVQQTLLEAYRSTQRMEGWTDSQRGAWLRQALANNLADEVRKLTTDKRDVRRDRSLEAELTESVSRLERLLPAQQSTPSQHLEREERMLRVVQALSCLPNAQRRAIELHHLGGQSLADVAAALETTKAAVAGLLHRGLKSLRATLAGDDDEAGCR